MKKIKKFSFYLLLLITIFNISNVKAYEMSKSMSANHSTTKISAKAIYYTHEVGRWSVGNPTILSTGGKGGGASKSGATSTRQSGSKYYATQKYSISATDFNYNTTSSTRTFQWCVNGNTNSWVSNECKVN